MRPTIPNRKVRRVEQSHIQALRYSRPANSQTLSLIPLAEMPHPSSQNPSVPILDSLFSHVSSQTKYFNWDRDISKYNYVIVTDTSFNRVDSLNHQTKIAWLLESPEITASSHVWLKQNINKFQHVFTFRRDLLQQYPDKCKFVMASSCWISPESSKLYPKRKLVSMISSKKKSTSGHKLRFEVISRLKNRLDLYGRGWNEIARKEDGLAAYMFSVAIENNKSDYYFTEKLLDCFATGTVPIYYGCPSIGDIFDPDGIIMVNNVNDVDRVLREITPQLYQSMLPAVTRNFQTLERFRSCNDYMYANHKNILLNLK